MLFNIYHFAVELTVTERECVRDILRDIVFFQSTHDNINVWKQLYNLPSNTSSEYINGERIVKCIRRTLQREKLDIPVQLSSDHRTVVCIIPPSNNNIKVITQRFFTPQDISDFCDISHIRNIKRKQNHVRRWSESDILVKAP